MFVVIENTPGYMPDADEPATFELHEDAYRYAVEEALNLHERMFDDGQTPNVPGRAQVMELLRRNQRVYLHDTDNMHDLGRVISIETTEDTE